MIKIRQYCYFAVRSISLPASDIAARLQMDVDEVVVMGSRFLGHGVPRPHAWKIVRRGTEGVDDQIEHLVSRLRPINTQLVALMEETDTTAVLQVVRYFDHSAGVTRAPGGSTCEVVASPLDRSGSLVCRHLKNGEASYRTFCLVKDVTSRDRIDHV